MAVRFRRKTARRGRKAAHAGRGKATPKQKARLKAAPKKVAAKKKAVRRGAAAAKKHGMPKKAAIRPPRPWPKPRPRPEPDDDGGATQE